MQLVTKPIDGPFGLEIEGIDLNATIGAELSEALNDALITHQVLLFRNQQLSDTRLVEVASSFGRVRDLPGGFRGSENVQGVRQLSNLGPDNKPNNVHPERWSQVWHTDGGFSQPPARATLLYCKQASSEGGSNEFIDMYGALESFTAAERARLETLDAIHDQDLARAIRHPRAPIDRPFADRWVMVKRWVRCLLKLLSRNLTVHPLVYVCPESNRAALILGSDTWRIRGMGWLRGMREVEKLTARAVREELVLRLATRSNDVLLWHNRSLLHRVTDYDIARDIRVMRQIVIMPR